MITVNEFRVRPVERFNITRYQRDDQGRARIGSVCEVAGFDRANEIARALVAGTPGAVLVEPGAHRELGEHTVYLSRFALGDSVRLKSIDQLGEVVGIRFTANPDRVAYDVRVACAPVPVTHHIVDSIDVVEP